MDTKSLPGMGSPECHLEGNLQCNFKEPNMSLGVESQKPNRGWCWKKKSHTPFKRCFSEGKTEASVSPPGSSTPCMEPLVCFCAVLLGFLEKEQLWEKEGCPAPEVHKAHSLEEAV